MDTVSAIRLKRDYGRFAMHVLEPEYVQMLPRRTLTGTKPNEQRRFRILKPLPDMKTYEGLLEKHFTFPISKLLTDAFFELKEIREELRIWLANVPDKQSKLAVEITSTISELDEIEEFDPPELIDKLGLEAFHLPGSTKNRKARCEDIGEKLARVAHAIKITCTEIESQLEGVDNKLEREEMETQIEDLKEFVDYVTSASSAAYDVEFPSLF